MECFWVQSILLIYAFVGLFVTVLPHPVGYVYCAYSFSLLCSGLLVLYIYCHLSSFTLIAFVFRGLNPKLFHVLNVFPMFSPTNFLLILPFWYFLSRVDFCIYWVCFIYMCMMHESVCIYVCTVLHICIWCAYVLYIFVYTSYIDMYTYMYICVQFYRHHILKNV